MPRESNISNDIQLPIEPQIKWEEPTVKGEDPETQTNTSDQPEIQEINTEDNILVDEEQQKQDAYGFWGGGLAGAIVAGITK